MKTALIGYTGFVGSNLDSQYSFTHKYNSKNFQEMTGQHFDLVVCAGVSAKKWIANAEPEADREAIKALEDVLATVKAERFVLISTIDVYPRPIDVTETDLPDLSVSQPYGKNRYLLEQFVAEHFSTHHIIRLPGLFGPGLRKNAIFDFINNNNVDKIHQGGVFQFYNTARLWQDIQIVIDNGLKLVNFTSEQVSIMDIVNEVFKNGWTNNIQTPAPSYDYKTNYAALWGKSGGYQFTKDEILEDIRQFVATEKPVM